MGAEVFTRRWVHWPNLPEVETPWQPADKTDESGFGSSVGSLPARLRPSKGRLAGGAARRAEGCAACKRLAKAGVAVLVCSCGLRWQRHRVLPPRCRHRPHRVPRHPVQLRLVRQLGETDA